MLPRGEIGLMLPPAPKSVRTGKPPDDPCRRPLPDDTLEALAAHAEAKKRLRHDLRGVLLVFLVMQWTMDGAPSPEQAAAMLGLQGESRWQAWHDAVKEAAADLVRVGY